MSGAFILDYFLLVFAASCGLYQMAAACNRLRGLMLFESRGLTFMLGLALWVGAFAWFFLSEPRNMPDTGAGLTGNEQFGYFFAGGGAGLAVTLAVTSLRNWRLGKSAAAPPAGLDALRDTGYARALFRSLMPILRPLPGDRRTSLAVLRRQIENTLTEKAAPSLCAGRHSRRGPGLRERPATGPAETPNATTGPGEGDG